MNDELHFSKGAPCISKIEEFNVDVTSQRMDVIQPTYDEIISFGTIFLLSKFCIDIRFIYPLSYPSTITLSIWHFPPSLLLSFSFFIFQYLTSFSSYLNHFDFTKNNDIIS